MFIVSVTNNNFEEEYFRYDCINKARKKYLPLKNDDDTFTASLSVEIESTDDMGEVMGIWETVREEL
jgi:hypothetical protein